MTTKKSQLRRLLAIYTLFMLLLLGGFAHSYSNFIRGFRTGYQTAESWTSEGGYYKYLLLDIPVSTAPEKVVEASCDTDCSAEIMTDRVHVVVRKASDENPILLAFRSLGDSGYLYWAILLLPLAKLSIFVLIGSEVLEGLIGWCMRTGAAEALKGSALTVDVSFPLSYWNLLMGVLMLFMAEVFAIGTRLGEEQKLTI